MSTKKWTILDLNARNILLSKVGKKLSNVELPKVMQLHLTLELDEELYNSIADDPSTVQKIQEIAKTRADEVLEKTAKELLAINKDIKWAEKGIIIKLNDINNSCLQANMNIAGREVEIAASGVIEKYKKGQSDLKKFKFKTSCKIVLGAASIAGSVTAAVLSLGTLSPVAIVGTVRGALGIAQNIAKLATDASQTAKLIQLDMAILKKLMHAGLEKKEIKEKVAQGAKEIGLNMLAKIVGVDTTSLKNCTERIKEHKVKIAALENTSKEMGKKINKIMDEQQALQQGLKDAKNLPKEAFSKYEKALSKSESTLNEILESTISTNEQIEKHKDLNRKFSTTLQRMEDGVPGWVKYVDNVLAIAVTLGHDATHLVNSTEACIQAFEELGSTHDAVTKNPGFS